MSEKAGSSRLQTDPPLARTDPVNEDGGTSVEVYL